MIVSALFALMLLAAVGIAVAIRARNMQYWLWGYLTRRRPPRPEGTVHVLFCFVDHFEPNWGRVDMDTQRHRVDRWCSEYRAMAARHRDADGRMPQHSFFYPEEEYVEEHLNKLAALCADGYGDANHEGRVIAAEYNDFYVVTAYTPNAKDDLTRIPLREKWDAAMIAYCADLQAKKPVIYCGDMNVAHTEDDLANPKPNRGKKGFTEEERGGFDHWLAAGFVDTLRIFKQGNGFYTWWSHFANARARNVGWRIDYFLVSETLKAKVNAADIHAEQMGSDHCPISITLKV